MVLEKVFKPNQRKVVLLLQRLLQVRCFCEVIKSFKLYDILCVYVCVGEGVKSLKYGNFRKRIYTELAKSRFAVSSQL